MIRTNETQLVQKEDFYITKDENGNDAYKVTQINENKVKYENLQTGEVNFAEKETEEYVESERELLEMDKLISKSASEDAFDLGAVSPSASSGFTYDRTVNNSTSLTVESIALVAGILASFIGLTTGIVTAIAGFYVSQSIPKAWWKERYYGKSETDGHRVVFTEKIQYVYYKYHDYTNYINTVTTY
ncbi:hypothetical protein [Gracilibacillus phocaeensis]|uniref:hypothetical protein n=1 Tax=Gracilibacillus phocaeensis TaxID=2042304 RepID=UPI0010326470|nr:hypothetical protein [Gracilibacillus phocaeensis]